MNENFDSDFEDETQIDKQNNLILLNHASSARALLDGVKNDDMMRNTMCIDCHNLQLRNSKSLNADIDFDKIEVETKSSKLKNLNTNMIFNGSCKSLSELDNIKRKTLSNLKNYQAKFRTLNNRFRFKRKSDTCKKHERLIRKNGDSNINRINIECRRRKYFFDMFNTIIDMRWQYLLIFFVLSFLSSWILFALFWFSLVHYKNSCVVNLEPDNFISAILFSIETQQTIGYGSRYINSDCPLAAFCVMVQSCFSVFLQSFMGGIVFAKLSRPKQRTETLMFSKNAVIAQRDGVYCLMCRVGDMRKSHIIQAHIRMFLVCTRYTKEGEIIPWNAQELEVGNKLKSTNRLLFMPIIVEHLITENSPLWNLIVKKNDVNSNEIPSFFKNEEFEIIVILEGIVEATGASMQARTSYISSEILWNHVFEPLLDRNLDKATVDYSKFHETLNLKMNHDYETNILLQNIHEPIQLKNINEKNSDNKRKKLKKQYSTQKDDILNRAYSNESKDTAYYSESL